MRIDDIISPESVCPTCGRIGTLAVADIEEPVYVGSTVVIVPVRAAVCSNCDDHIYDPEAQGKLDAAAKTIREGRVNTLVHVGEVYHA